MTFLDQLREAETLNQSMLCVGLDPEPSRFPTGITRDAEGIHDFCLKIVEATADLAIAFKPQIAYFAAHRAEPQLERLIARMREIAPKVPVIRMPSAATSAARPSSTPRRPSSATAPTP